MAALDAAGYRLERPERRRIASGRTRRLGCTPSRGRIAGLRGTATPRRNPHDPGADGVTGLGDVERRGRSDVSVVVIAPVPRHGHGLQAVEGAGKLDHLGLQRGDSVVEAL